MWRYQVGCLEMVLSYFKEKVEDAGHHQSLRDFLFDVLSCHDQVFSNVFSSQVSEETTSACRNIEASERNQEIKQQVQCQSVSLEADEDTHSIFNCHLEPVSLKALPSNDTLAVNKVEGHTSSSNNVERISERQDLITSVEESISLTGYWNIKKETDNEETVLESSVDASQSSSELQSNQKTNLSANPDISAEGPTAPSWPSTGGSRLHFSGEAASQPQVPPRFICSYCPRVFASSGQKQIHERSHLKARPFVCSFCGKTFTSKNGKVIHERMHTNERPFACAYCPRTFYQNCDKLKHERTHTKEKPYACAYCLKRFSDASSKIRHERLHRNERLHACAFCPKAFACSGSRRAHERKHRLERAYACLFCPKTFGDNDERLLHEKGHKVAMSIASPCD